MKNDFLERVKKLENSRFFWFFVVFVFIAFMLLFIAPMTVGNVSYDKNQSEKVELNKVLTFLKQEEKKEEALPLLDTALYDLKLKELANNKVVPAPEPKYNEKGELIPPLPQKPNLWPKDTVYPNAGAILPFNRVVAYYGNLYSKKMGVLGEYPEEEMLAKLDKEVKKWNEADPSTPVVPALHYIVVVAQGTEGADGKYRFRMPDSEIQKVLEMANKINAIVFLDIQVAFSDIQTELPLLDKYLKLPNVHLGIDPEFSMKTGIRPGKVVGTMDGELDVNFAINYLSKIVQENNLTPKILVVHRYTQKMLTNASKIKPTQQVQVVINMDGWGGKDKKIGTYKNFIYPEPVQFTGFKIFYKNDIKEPNTVIFEPQELLKLNPRPIYIQYQ
jgi:hypothetical protein